MVGTMRIPRSLHFGPNQIRFILLSAVICLVLTHAPLRSQTFAGQALPVAQRQDPPQLLRMRFLTLVFGREGPMDTALLTTPVMAREYFVEADLHGIESVASIRFQFIDGGGRELQSIPMWKSSDSSTDGEFFGLVTVPSQPFRAAISGTGTNGSAIQSVFSTLFQPAAGGTDAPPMIPQGIPSSETGRIQSMMDAYREELRAQARQAVAAHPDGTIQLSRNIVSPITYETLNSPSGFPIGLRLRYSIRFTSQQTIRALPHVFPDYTLPVWRGVVAMKPLTGSITPLPGIAGVQSLQDVIQYEAAATYQPGTAYSFSIDLIPDFVYQGTQSGRFCVHNQKVTNRDIWNALISSNDSVSYSVSISDTNTTVRIPNSFPIRTFYESFVAGGAGDCGPVPNVRF